MVKTTKFLLPIFMAAASPAMADEIKLTTHSGGTVITGEFVEFRDGSFVVLFEGQEVTVNADLVICEGIICMDALAPTSEG